MALVKGANCDVSTCFKASTEGELEDPYLLCTRYSTEVVNIPWCHTTQGPTDIRAINNVPSYDIPLLPYPADAKPPRNGPPRSVVESCGEIAPAMPGAPTGSRLVAVTSSEGGLSIGDRKEPEHAIYLLHKIAWVYHGLSMSILLPVTVDDNGSVAGR